MEEMHIKLLILQLKSVEAEMRFHTFELLPQHLEMPLDKKFRQMSGSRGSMTYAINLSGLFYFPRIIRHQ